MPKISINIITYNRAAYLPEAIRSVLEQSFSDWELIIVDDASTDNTESVVKNFIAADSRVKYFKNDQNKGVARSRNRALMASQGDFIAVLDSDDLWCNTEKLQKQLEVFVSNKDAVLVGGNGVIIDKNGVEHGDYICASSDKQIRQKFLLKNQFIHSSVMFSRQVAASGGYDESLVVGEDYDLFLRLGKGGKISNLPFCVVKYRKHDSNQSKEKILSALKDNLKIIARYKNNYPNYCIALCRRYVRFLIGTLLVSLRNIF